MSLGVLNNLSAMYAANNLNNTSNSLNTVLQQLSSGSKINSGADDAAGLSLVNGLQANSVALAQSQTNAAEGVGLLKVADGALSQVTNLLNRAVTLATEASNGTLNASQDAAANSEYQSILAEINNIGSTTTYNGQTVFGSVTNIYTGDSSISGASVDQLNIRSLSSSNVGNSGGAMSYSNGQNNVFLNLSTSGMNAQATDTLNGGASGSTSITVQYLVKGGSGSQNTATTTISVGGSSGFANTANGLISAINSSGLGLNATFATQASAGVQGGGTQTGIQISGGLVSAGVDPNSSSTSGTLELGGLAAGATLALGATVTVNQGSNSHTFTIDSTNNTLANLASQISSQAGLGVSANVITNGDGTQSLALADSSSTGGALSVSTTAGTVQAPTFSAGTTGSTVAVQSAGSAVAGSQYVAAAASAITIGTGGTDSGSSVLTLGTSITIQNSIANDTQNLTFVIGNGTDVSGSGTGTYYTGNVDAGAASDTLTGLADTINSLNATLGVYATVGATGLTLMTGTWDSVNGVGTPTTTSGQNVSVTANNLTAADSTTALSLYDPTVGGAAAGVGSPTTTILDSGSGTVQTDAVTGSLTLTNMNGTFTYNASAGDTWATVLGAINGSNLGVTATWNATENGAGNGALVLTGNVDGVNPITLSANTLVDTTNSNAGVVSNTSAPGYSAGSNATPATPSTAILQLSGAGQIDDATAKLGGAVSLTYNGNTQIFIMGAPPSGSTAVAGAIYTGGTSVTSLVNAINADATLGLSATAPGGSGSGGIYLQGAAGVASPITMNALTAGTETGLSVTTAMTKDGLGTATGSGSVAVTGQAGNNAVDNVVAATSVSTSDVMSGGITISNGGVNNKFIIGSGSNSAVAGTFYTDNTDTGGVNYGNTLAGLASAITALSTNHVSAQANTSGLTLTQTGSATTYTGGNITTSANTLTDVTQGDFSTSTTNQLASKNDALSGALVFNVGGSTNKTVAMSDVTGAGFASTADGLVSYIQANQGTLGVTASWVPAGGGSFFGAIELKSNTEGASGTVNVSSGLTSLVDTTGGAALTYTANNAYNTGLSGSIADTTTGQTAATFFSNSKVGSGTATISYTDGAGQSLSSTDLLNATDAQATLNALNKAITAVAAQDGYIGAQINTLNAVSSVLSTQQQNVVSAQNAVQATDYATAASNMSKYEILSQTGISALAQANSMQQEVTKLLQ